VVRMGEERKWYKFCWESSKERDHSEDRGVDGKIGLGAGGCGVDSPGSV
jgi:hypothetical protein